MTSTTLLVTARWLVAAIWPPRCGSRLRSAAMVRANSDRASWKAYRCATWRPICHGRRRRRRRWPSRRSVTARHVGDWGQQLYRAINVVALEHMILAARQHGRLRRWVQIIRSASIGPASPRQDESTPPDLTGLDGYTQTKAEPTCLNHHVQEDGFPRHRPPRFHLREGSRHAFARIVDKVTNGKMRSRPRRPCAEQPNVHNLVDAIMLAIERPDSWRSVQHPDERW